mgnify:CR=1 FL=1
MAILKDIWPEGYEFVILCTEGQECNGTVRTVPSPAATRLGGLHTVACMRGLWSCSRCPGDAATAACCVGVLRRCQRQVERCAAATLLEHPFLVLKDEDKHRPTPAYVPGQSLADMVSDFREELAEYEVEKLARAAEAEAAAETRTADGENLGGTVGENTGAFPYNP